MLETRLRLAAGLAEERVMLVETLNQGQGDLVGIAAVESDGDFHISGSSPFANLSTGHLRQGTEKAQKNVLLRNVKSRFVD